MAVKLHRCSSMWARFGGHPCWKVQSALDEAGVPYEIVKHPAFPRGRRAELERLTGQRKLPVLELEDGTIIRDESSELVKRIKAGDFAPPSAA